MSHRDVKAALLDRLTDALPARLPEGFPVVWTSISDVQPEDETRWPWAIVQTTRAPGERRTGTPGEWRVTYEVKVTCGVMSTIGDLDEAAEDATGRRDDLLLAVREALLWQPSLTEGGLMRLDPTFTEDTSPTPVDQKSRAIALGSWSGRVHAYETIGPPDGTDPGPEIETADVTVTAHDAATNPLT